MKRLVQTFGLAAIVGGLGAAGPREAKAEKLVFSGTICNPDKEGRDDISYLWAGVLNSTGLFNVRRITCGISLPSGNDGNGYAVEGIHVNVFDNTNPGNVGCRVVYATTLSGWASGMNPGIVEYPWKYTVGSSSSPQTLNLAYAGPSSYHMTVQCDLPWGTSVGNIIVFGTDSSPPTDPTAGSVTVTFTWTNAPDPVGPDACEKRTLLLCNEVPSSCPLSKMNVSGSRPQGGTSCIYTHTFLGVSPATFPHIPGSQNSGDGWVRGGSFTGLSYYYSGTPTKIVPGQLVQTQPFSGN